MEMVLRIKKNIFNLPPGNGRMLLRIILWYLFAWILIGYLKFPKAIVYFGDVLNLYVFLCAIKYCNREKIVPHNLSLLFMVLFIVTGLISAIANFVSPMLVFWGLRNNLRYFIFFYSSLVFIDVKTVQYVLKLVAILFWVSFPLCLYQRYFISYSNEMIIGDYIGGVFWGFQGVTAPLNVILIIYTIYITSRFFDNKCNVWYFFSAIIAALLMAAMSELKVFIVEIVVIVIWVMIQKRVSWKTWLLCIVGIMGSGIVINWFVVLNGTGRGYYTTDLFSLQSMLEIVTADSGYDGIGDVNRLNGIKVLNERFFSNDILGTLFGLGIGNADYANFNILTSDFYKNYSSLHYQWFSTTFVFIETGIVGVIMYAMIIISAFAQGAKTLGKRNPISGCYYILLIMMLFLCIYNTSLRNEHCAFILYFLLALPEIYKERKRK